MHARMHTHTKHRHMLSYMGVSTYDRTHVYTCLHAQSTRTLSNGSPVPP